MRQIDRRRLPSIGTLVLVGGLIALLGLAAGFVLTIIYLGHSHAQWNNSVDWGAILNFAGATLNAVTVFIVAWLITVHFQRRETGRVFEREMLAAFAKSAFASVERVHERLLDCRKRGAIFTELDRQEFVLLFTALGQELQIIEDTLEATNGPLNAVESAQSCRSQYKDLLTDRDIGTAFSQEEERAGHLKHRELRNHIVHIMLDAGRQ